ncbi:MAG: hypothetical protein MJB57_01080 [Gemmatimonadetes bacterium]|nr:hypothetical protein [Gemmatimonadota bacterium]
MHRRALLKRTGLGWLGWWFAWRRAPVSRIPQEASGPSSLEEAVRTGDPEQVKAFILTNRGLSRNAPLSTRIGALEVLEGQARARLLESMRSGTALPDGPAPDVPASRCMEYQLAAGTLLSGIDDEDLRYVGRQMGGLDLLSARDRYYRDTGLRTVLARAIRLLEPHAH